MKSNQLKRFVLPMMLGALAPVLFSSFAFAQSQSQSQSQTPGAMPAPARGLELTVTGQGTVGIKQEYKTLGHATVPTMQSYLKDVGGYVPVVMDYYNSNAPGSRSENVWEKAASFRAFVSNRYGVTIDHETAAMQFGLDRAFWSNSDEEIFAVAKEVGAKLTFEQKIAWGSWFGGVFSNNYDTSRIDNGENGKGIVTLRQMILAQQQGGKAGVCRDISVGVAQILTHMGVSGAYIQTHRTPGSSHAVVLVQDPSNANKIYTINYSYMTSQESNGSTAFLRQDGTIPAVGITNQIYDANGRRLTALPSAMGMTLHKLSGGGDADFDPMGRDYGNALTTMVEKPGSGLSVGVGVGETETGATVMGFIAQGKSGSERAPTRFGIVVYQSKNPTSLYGEMKTEGVYISGSQKIYSKPQTISLRDGGRIQMKVVGSLDVAFDLATTKVVDYDDGGLNADNAFVGRTGGLVDYKSGDGRTRVEGSVVGAVGLGSGNVRDGSAKSMGMPYYKDTTVALFAGQMLSSDIEGFMRAQVVSRREGLGTQSRQEVGVQTKTSGVTVGHEGPLTKTRPAFVPGNIPRYFVEANVGTKNKRFSLRSGVYCLESDLDNCAIRGQGRLTVPLKGKVLGF